MASIAKPRKTQLTLNQEKSVMWEKLKALPIAIKVIIGLFVAMIGFSVVMSMIGLVFLAIHYSHDPQPPQKLKCRRLPAGEFHREHAARIIALFLKDALLLRIRE